MNLSLWIHLRTTTHRMRQRDFLCYIDAYSHVTNFSKFLNVKNERKFFVYSSFLLHPIQVLSCSISLRFSLFYNYFFTLISTINIHHFDFPILSRTCWKFSFHWRSRGISLSSPRDKTLNQARLKVRVS